MNNKITYASKIFWLIHKMQCKINKQKYSKIIHAISAATQVSQVIYLGKNWFVSLDIGLEHRHEWWVQVMCTSDVCDVWKDDSYYLEYSYIPWSNSHSGSSQVRSTGICFWNTQESCSLLECFLVVKSHCKSPRGQTSSN